MRRAFKIMIVAVVMVVLGIFMMWGLTLMAVPDVEGDAEESLYFPDEYGGRGEVKLGNHEYEVWVGSEEMFIPPEVWITDAEDSVVWVGEESDQQLRNKNMFGKFDCPGGTYTVHVSRFTEVHFVEGEVKSWDPKGTVCAGGIIGLVGGLLFLASLVMLFMDWRRSSGPRPVQPYPPQHQQPYPPQHQQPYPPGYPQPYQRARQGGDRDRRRTG